MLPQQQNLSRSPAKKMAAGILPNLLACIPAGLGLLLAGWPAQARAEFTVCNQTFDVANIAVGQAVGQAETGLFETEGWWTIGANQCVNVIREELSNRFIYVYARDVFGQPILSGTTEMCVDGRRFVIRGIEDCWQRGHQAVRFIEVDTLEQERWTLFLTAVEP